MLNPNQKFVREVGRLISAYDDNKPAYRKKCASLFGVESYFSRSTYVEELTGVYNNIKNKEALTMFDLIWFYKECYSPLGKHSNPQMYGDATGNPSAETYRAIKALIARLWPESIGFYDRLADSEGPIRKIAGKDHV